MKKMYFVIAALLFSAITFGQGVTTSSMGGKVTDSAGEPLPGASIVAVHTPSGTKYGAATDFDGFYRISGMRTGGPYTVTISYVGFQDFVQENVMLQLGQTKRISTVLVESATELEGVVLTGDATGTFSSNKTGAETNVSQRDIQTIPSASRSVADFVRLTPQAQITEGNDGFSISLGGQNNRFNAVYIDGAVNNDVFGLAGSGTNGGQTGVNPFSVDAIESFQVQIAPFDVRISGFSGGAISATTRSGTNNWEGSVYGFLRNESLAGKTPTDLVGDGDEREKLDEFTAATYGFRVGGPIIKDKLFFFLNYERQDDETPQPFNVSQYTGDSSPADIQRLRDGLISQYGYDPGVFDQNTATLESNKITAKLDWNINDNNNLSFRYGLVDGENLEARNSNTRRIAFLNGSEFFKTVTNSFALELNSRIGNKFSNNLLVGYTRVRDDRDPFGNPFPSVVISDGLNRFSGQGIQFGAEQFSTANLLDQDVFTITDNFEIYSGAHTITIGTHNEFTSVKNLFFASNFGFYAYGSVDDFLANQNLQDYETGYSLLGDGTVGDESAGAAEFDLKQYGFYIQDEFQVTDDFKLSMGLRFDIPTFEDGIANDDFNNRTVGLLEAAGKDLQGARVGRKIETTVNFSPRFGFNWDVNGKNTTQIRGGLGIFTSRIPLVWPGGTYNNNGVTGGFSDEGDFADELTFNPDVNDQPVSVAPGSGGVGGNIDLFAPDFKLPQVFKFNVAVDQKLPIWGLVASADFVWNDNINAIYYENLNIRGPEGFLSGRDNRPFYDRRNTIDDTYNRIILASNTQEGNSWNTSLTIRKPFTNGFQGQASWSYGDANAIFDGTSSQNSSQWRNIQTVNGKNSNIPVSRSDFSQGHRVNSFMSYEFRWNENVKSTVGFYYEGAQGNPFSYIYAEGGRFSSTDLLNDDSRDNALIFIPAGPDDINLIDIVDGDGAVVRTAAQQWEDLNSFIESNDYLRERRGQHAERNGDRASWSHVVDFKFLQDFSINWKGKKHTLQASIDIFNFTNLLNKDWGVRNFVSGGEVALIRTERGGPDPEFQFDASRFENGIEDIDDRGIQSSRWQAQVGLRYIFK
ncbi:TonB-dependent receptor [Spongiimicrobium salis]|uniref:TonB-dependent receptor n=1 Tax=Spongiimicrobium salis TaxID=1667022 RepID=UPI00374CB178